MTIAGRSALTLVVILPLVLLDVLDTFVGLNPAVNGIKAGELNEGEWSAGVTAPLLDSDDPDVKDD